MRVNMFRMTLRCFTLLFAMVVTLTHAQCPADNTENCECERRFAKDYIVCENLGNVSQIPSFNRSERVFQQLHIRNDRTTVNTIQSNAFHGLRLYTLRFHALGIRHIQPNAFAGLEDFVREIYLDENSLESIPENVFSNLEQLSYLGLENNNLDSIPAHAMAGLPRLN